MDLYQQYIAKSRYARYLSEQNRREHFSETVDRYVSYMCKHVEENNKVKVDDETKKKIYDAIYNLEVMPSMRALMTSGKALDRDHTAGYNCSYIPVDDPKAFDEAMHILMCGTGVGFSVERQYVNQLPDVPDKLFDSETIISVKDSKEGWAKALRMLLALLYSGEIPKWDLSKLRPAGAPLKTFGGRSSGPAPLDDLFKFTVNLFKNAVGRKLTSIECHDIMCKIGEVVVVGGVRRSAMISLSNLSDDRMRNAKSGAWWEANVQRSLANNSAVYNEKPDVGLFMKEWLSLYESKSGERGIFSRDASQRVAKRSGRRNHEYEFGTNPCSEIILRPYQFCNLSEVVIRQDDTIETITEKVYLASILGTWQASLLYFPYLSSEWRKNCEEEALLGVSLTGILDNAMMRDMHGLKANLENLKQHAIITNKEWAKKLGINAAAAITCIKPSGTVSQLTDAASGIHARHNQYYIRTVRADRKDPLCQLMIDKGFPHEPCVMKPDSVMIFSFPMKAEGSVTRNDMSAIEHLELWLAYQRNWCEHKPSITVTVREHEWMEVGAWVYKHFDEISGISFLPHSDHSYRQAPYQDTTKEHYEAFLEKMPKSVDWSELTKYEKVDSTVGTQTFACSGDKCELVDLTSSN